MPQVPSGAGWTHEIETATRHAFRRAKQTAAGTSQVPPEPTVQRGSRTLLRTHLPLSHQLPSTTSGASESQSSRPPSVDPVRRATRFFITCEVVSSRSSKGTFSSSCGSKDKHMSSPPTRECRISTEPCEKACSSATLKSGVIVQSFQRRGAVRRHVHSALRRKDGLFAHVSARRVRKTVYQRRRGIGKEAGNILLVGCVAAASLLLVLILRRRGGCASHCLRYHFQKKKGGGIRKEREKELQCIC